MPSGHGVPLVGTYFTHSLQGAAQTFIPFVIPDYIVP